MFKVKNKVYRIMISILIAVLVAGISLSLASCNKNNDGGDATEVRVLVPDGAPALAVAKLIKDAPVFDGYKVTYEIVKGATAISDKLVNNSGELAIVPTNMASILYNKIGAKLISTNIQGLLYLVGKENLTSLEDLKGKVVYNIGQGATPDVTFKYILSQNNIDYRISDTADPDGKLVSLHYVSSAEALIPLLSQGIAKFGILGEPQVSQAVKVAEVQTLFDMQTLWKNATGSTDSYPQTSLIMTRFLQDDTHKKFINDFVNKLIENETWISNNAAEAQSAIKAGGSALAVTLNADIIGRCNIKTVKAGEAKAAVEAYLNVLYSFNKASVGGAMPGSDFYYAA